jgi:hypothetical protein
MMVACPPHSPTPLLMMTLPSPPCLPNVCKKIKGKAPIPKWWVDKMGPSAAFRRIGSKMSYGKGGCLPTNIIPNSPT